MPSMYTYTTRLMGSRYLGEITLQSIELDNCPITLMVGASIFSSPRVFETSLFDKIIVHGNILNSLEEGYFNTQIIQFSLKFILFWGALFRMDNS